MTTLVLYQNFLFAITGIEDLFEGLPKTIKDKICRFKQNPPASLFLAIKEIHDTNQMKIFLNCIRKIEFLKKMDLSSKFFTFLTMRRID